MSLPSFLGPLKSLVLPEIDREPTALLSDSASALPVGGAGARQHALPGFLMQLQEQTQWCWAAVTASIADYYRASAWHQQCVVASREKSSQCCNSQNPGICNVPTPLDGPLTRTGHFSNGRVDSPQQFDVVEQEIGGQRALACRVVWGNGTAHFVAVTACSVDASGAEYVEIGDPLQPGPTNIPYDEFVSNYRGEGTWTNSYFTLSAAIAAGGAESSLTAPLAP